MSSLAPGIKQTLQLWPFIIALVVGAGTLAEARYRLNALEQRVEKNETQQQVRHEQTSSELRKMNTELRVGLGKVQLSMARICIKLDVECE